MKIIKLVISLEIAIYKTVMEIPMEIPNSLEIETKECFSKCESEFPLFF